MVERLPFEAAISDPKLLKTHFDTLSAPQQVVLKAFNGMGLSAASHPKSPYGFSELDYWSMLQGGAIFDELGYVKKISSVPYVAKKRHTLVAILGRRSGKTDRITATQLAYEALLGGHMQYVEPDQDVKILFIAQDIETAGSHLNFVYNAMRSSPLLFKEVEKFNADVLKLKNGLKIEPSAATITSSRGLAVPGWCGDEVGFWYTDAKAANPDFEVERAVEYAMAQFPDAFKFITSTPYTKEGMLWKYHLAGTEGSKLPEEDREEHEGVLVVHAPTAAMENPRLMHAAGKRRLVRLQKRDPDAFERESLAKFVDSISGFLKPEILRTCVASGILQREKLPRPGHSDDPTPIYIAAMDPAFRHDNFAFTIMHHDLKDGIVQDYFQEWEPQLGVPLNPTEVLSEIKLVLDQYGVNTVYSDQYQLEALQQLALGHNFTIIGIDFTSSSKAKIYGSLRSLVNSRRIRLLDNESMFNQLTALEKKRSPQGAIQISAPAGKKDDAAAATALCAAQCVWMLPTIVAKVAKEQTHVQEGLECIRRRREQALREDMDDDD